MKRLWVILPIFFSYSCEYPLHMWEWENSLGIEHDWWFYIKQFLALIAIIGFIVWIFFSSSSGYSGPDDGDVDDF